MSHLTKNIRSRKQLLEKIIPLKFPDALKTVLEEYDLKKEIIEDEFNISYRTIEHYLYKETNPEKTTLMQVLTEIGCYFEISQLVLAKAGFVLTVNDAPYFVILEQEGKLSIHDCNVILIEYNESLGANEKKLPLFKEKKKD